MIVGDTTNFEISDAMSGALVKLHPGGMRQLHWHTNLDEWQFVINGTIQVCISSVMHCACRMGVRKLLSSLKGLCQ